MVIKPTFKIKANDKDVTTSLCENLISLSFKDCANNEADQLTLKLAKPFKRPKFEDELELYLGYENNLTFCGIFFVQTTSIENNQNLTITATGVNFSNSLKEIKNITYEKVSIKEICSQIASRNDLKLKSDFDDVYILSIAQSKQSDLDFLDTLARNFNAIFNIKNKTLYFIKNMKKEKKNPTLPIYNIDVNNTPTLSIKYSNKLFYKSCKMSWHDTKENRVKSVIVGEGKPVLIKSNTFKDEAQALLTAKATLDSANSKVISGSLTIKGDIYFAGGLLNLKNTVQDDGTYAIKTVNHQLTNSGWTTSIEFGG